MWDHFADRGSAKAKRLMIMLFIQGGGRAVCIEGSCASFAMKDITGGMGFCQDGR